MDQEGGAPADHLAPEEPASAARGRIVRGLGVNVAGNALTILIQLVTVPVLLTAWGVDTYGAWLVLSAVPLYVGLSDLGFPAAAGNTMTMLEGRGDRAAAIQLGRETWSLVLALTCSGVALAILVGSVVIGLAGDGSAIPASEARVVLLALFANVVVSSQFGVLDAWYRAGARYPLGVLFRQLGRVLEFGALVAAVLLGAGPGTAAIAFLAGSVVGYGLSLLALRRAVPWSRGPSVPRSSTARGLLAPGLAFLAFPLANTLSVQGFIIVIGGVLGAAAVVVFATTRTLTRVVIQVLTSINLAIWPELSRSMGRGDLDHSRRIQRRAVQLSLVMALSAAVVLLVFGPAIIRAWTGGLVDPPIGLLGVLVLVSVANCAWFTLVTPLIATNRHRRLAVVYLASSAAAVLLAIPLATWFGLVGAAVALLVIDVAMTAYVLPSALQIVDDTPRAFLRGLMDGRGALRSLRMITSSWRAS